MAKQYERLGPVIDDWMTADGLILMESWAREGYTVQDIATRIGITQQALRSWMNKYPEVKQAINNGRELVDYKVENALLKAALGYKTKEVRVSTTIRNGKTIETVKETVEREAAPNVAACTTWLYNRQPKKWKNMNVKSNFLEEMDEDTSIHIVVERASNNECKNTNAPTTPVRSSSFEEVDTDWQNDVNKEIILTRKPQANVSEDTEADTSSEVCEPERARSIKGSAKAPKVDTKSATVYDEDYWPDDWVDED